MEGYTTYNAEGNICMMRDTPKACVMKARKVGGEVWMDEYDHRGLIVDTHLYWKAGRYTKYAQEAKR